MALVLAYPRALCRLNETREEEVIVEWGSWPRAAGGRVLTSLSWKGLLGPASFLGERVIPGRGSPTQCLETHLVSETSSAYVQSFFSFCSQIMRTNSKPTFPKDQKILSFPEAPPPGLPRPL
ncbi:unnamed protein product [Rangifer tarandus platyrhynchus]|uniref:Uncharacterized protein n=2 Tax=Rangifer tarandus platyrhynchus TaxID=3082113 RepID=A0AC59YVU4_RANTA|nr:unnamed protein product [Rangifer tarandus platyrhynchus]